MKYPVCTGKACVISGSQHAMRYYIAEIDPEGWKKNTIKKTRFGEIVRGLQLGAAYAFDKESYGRFYPLARKEGLPVAEGDFKEQKSKDFWFFIVQQEGVTILVGPGLCFMGHLIFSPVKLKNFFKKNSYLNFWVSNKRKFSVGPVTASVSGNHKPAFDLCNYEHREKFWKQWE